MATSMLSALASMHYTSVAESMTIFATSPFLTVAFAFILIDERPNATTICASLVAFCGVLYMVSDNPGGGTGLGRALAVVFTVSTALMSTILRKHREVEMLPSMIMASLICAAAMAPFASFSMASPDDLLCLALFGIVQSGIAQAAYTIGVRYIPAAVASLFVALEVPLSPLWVWLIIDEVPTRTMQVGGAIVLAALVAHIALELSRARRASVIS